MDALDIYSYLIILHYDMFLCCLVLQVCCE